MVVVVWDWCSKMGLLLNTLMEEAVGEGVLVEVVESWLQLFSSSAAASRDLPLPRRL